MTTDTTYIELLRMAHESLDSKDKQIAELEEELSTIVSGLFSENELAIRDLKQHDKGVDSAIAELTICYRVALDEHKDYEDAEVLEGLIDRLQALKEQE
tara:strand:+ start:308 stop:604 length:297 start_codon:yes stop_codon:yes gene_type:complete